MTANPEPSPGVLTALARFYLVIDPASAESRWRASVEYDLLPEDHRAPNHIYRFARGSGVIVYDADRNGQFFKEMPPGIDPATIVDVPAVANVPSLASVIAAQLERAGASAHASALGSNIVAVAEPAQPRRALDAFRQEISPALGAGIDGLRSELDSLADGYAGTLLEARNTGRDAAAVRLLAAMAREIDAADRILERALSRDASSLEETSVMFERDAIMRGFGEQVFAAAEKLRKDADTAVETAREGAFPPGHPELALTIFYTALFAAALRVQAARIGYIILGLNPAIDERARTRFKTNENVAEEKLMRITTALLYAIKDITGAGANAARAEIEALKAQGKTEEADARLTDIINAFDYPRTFRRLLGGDPAPPA